MRAGGARRHLLPRKINLNPAERFGRAMSAPTCYRAGFKGWIRITIFFNNTP